LCINEAVAWWAGEPHSDRPRCLSRVIGDFTCQWNDSLSNADRQLLVPFIPRLAGTAASDAVEERREWMIADWGWRVSLPAWLRGAGLTLAAEVAETSPPVVDTPSQDRIRHAVRRVMGEPLSPSLSDIAAGLWRVPHFAVSASGTPVWSSPHLWCSAAAHAALQQGNGHADHRTQAALLRSTVVQVQATALTLLERLIDAGEPHPLGRD
jgi:hypothetical protein